MKDNNFGNYWTEEKAEIFMKYVSAYLNVMKKNSLTIAYFDGFSGSGSVKVRSNHEIDSIAYRVLTLDHEKEFDRYWLVEMDGSKLNKLIRKIKDNVPEARFSKIHSKAIDCNIALKSLSKWFECSKREHYRLLALIDPFGMCLDFESIQGFSRKGVDIWFLIPTGVGPNRLLVTEGDIQEPWWVRLERFFGKNRNELREIFYYRYKEYSMFEESLETVLKKGKGIERCAELYVSQLKSVFSYVSRAYPLVNSKGNTMYHFVLATNHPLGLKIANDIVGKGLSNRL